MFYIAKLNAAFLKGCADGRAATSLAYAQDILPMKLHAWKTKCS
jgi:hypothetical protein